MKKIAVLTVILMSTLVQAQTTVPSAAEVANKNFAFLSNLKGVVGVMPDRCAKGTNDVVIVNSKSNPIEDCISLLVDSEESKELLEKVLVGTAYSKEGFARLGGYALGYIVTGVFQAQ